MFAPKKKVLLPPLLLQDFQKNSQFLRPIAANGRTALSATLLSSPQYTDTQLIATYSPSRAKKDKGDRERLVEKLKQKLSDIPNETSVKKLISNGGYKKYTTVKEGSLLTLNEKTIEEDASWDGFHGIAVSNSAQCFASTIFSGQRQLSLPVDLS